MRIGSSNIGMESSRNFRSLSARRTSVEVRAENAGLRMNPKAEDGTENSSIMGQDAWQKFYGEDPYADKKKEIREKLNEMNSRSGVKKLSHVQNKRDALSTVRDRCMQYLFSIFFGETKKWDFGELVSKAQAESLASGPVVMREVSYCQETYVEEMEETVFSTQGMVQTEDGRTITFQLNLQMSRSFQAYYKENYTRMDSSMIDPLVINLEGDVANLQDQTFFFDLDADGVEEEISMLGKGSGYLALDKNGDGVINDGSELFGTKSGDGFADLAAYDADGNLWIDENDEIWDKLLIWTKDEYGSDRCYKLSEKNVGAICLSSASTDFSLTSQDNASDRALQGGVNGRIRKTGIFLYENGYAGTIQHVDMAAHGQKEQGRFDAAG
ncbi:MAG: hypothetical protein K2P19_03335 [Kineothrix sp.]|nr:hypothetical protein [Kineothrix sp.]